jgi:hypothetical protein
MDVEVVASGVAALLAAKAADAAAGEAGRSLWASLLAVVRSRFAGDHHATAVVQRLVTDPTVAHQTAVAALLEDNAGRDESFARELGRLLEAARREPDVSHVVVNVSGNASVGHMPTIGTHIGDMNFGDTPHGRGERRRRA